MVALKITASNFEFDEKPYSDAFNKAIYTLFREAARRFYRAAVARIPVRTGFVRGAFGVLGDLIGEGPGVGGSHRAVDRLRKAHLLQKKIAHLEATIEKVKKYEVGGGVFESERQKAVGEKRAKEQRQRQEALRSGRYTGITEEGSSTRSVDTLGGQHSGTKRSGKVDSASSELDRAALAQGRAAFDKGESQASRTAKGLEKLLGGESHYSSAEVHAYEEGRRAEFEAAHAEFEEIHRKGKEALQKAEYTRQRERLEGRVAKLKERGARLAKEIDNKSFYHVPDKSEYPVSAEHQRGTLALLESLRRQAKIEKPAGPFQATAAEQKKLSPREYLKLSAEQKAARAKASTKTAKQVRQEYLRKRRDELLGVKDHSTPRWERYNRWRLQRERGQAHQVPYEFYHAPDGTVTLKTLSSGRNFAKVSLPDTATLDRGQRTTAHSTPIPVNSKVTSLSGATGVNTINIPNRYDFSFSIDISYFNINDTNGNKFTPSAPWGAMAAGRLAFKNYINSNYLTIPSIVSFVREIEYELNINGTITKRTKSTSGIGFGAGVEIGGSDDEGSDEGSSSNLGGGTGQSRFGRKGQKKEKVKKPKVAKQRHQSHQEEEKFLHDVGTLIHTGVTSGLHKDQEAVAADAARRLATHKTKDEALEQVQAEYLSARHRNRG